MTQIPLIAGTTATESADFNVSLPVNLEPVPTDSGISKGYIRSAAGAISLGDGPGIDRGGIVFGDTLIRVMGTKLVSVTSLGVATELGDVGAGGPVGFALGFGRLAIQSGTSLYFWNGASLAQVTDPDLGACLDVVWFKNQFFSTDGTYIVALNINDPFVVDPLKYGSAESDPDGITGLTTLRNELLATGGSSIEIFSYVGGSNFPLQVSDGATIPIGSVGPRSKCTYSQTIAFVGSARNEANAVWMAGQGTATKISTRAIDDFLAVEPNPEAIQLESRTSRDEERLYVHLSDKTLVFLRVASQQAGQPVWYIAASGQGFDQPYRPRNAILYANEWIVGDVSSAAIGKLDDGSAEHFGEAVGWRFDTRLLYNEGNGLIAHELELIGLPGRAALGEMPVAFLSWTIDGETWSVERPALLGIRGQRSRRMSWRPHKRISRYAGLRFRGNSSGLAGFAALEARLEPLS